MKFLVILAICLSFSGFACSGPGAKKKTLEILKDMNNYFDIAKYAEDVPLDEIEIFVNNLPDPRYSIAIYSYDDGVIGRMVGTVMFKQHERLLDDCQFANYSIPSYK